MMASRFIYFGLALLLIGCAGRKGAPSRPAAEGGVATKPLRARQVAVLNELRAEINGTYGFVDGWPRINRGPCGRFAKIFHEQWNVRFKQKINVVFVMMPNVPDGVGCDHVLVKLPDGSYYDGGGGVMSGSALLRQFRAGDRIEEMTEFDLAFGQAVLRAGPFL
jgi:hypothetical protein